MGNTVKDITNGIGYNVEKIFEGLSPRANKDKLEFALTNVEHVKIKIVQLQTLYGEQHPFYIYCEPMMQACFTLNKHFSELHEGKETRCTSEEMNVLVHFIDLAMKDINNSKHS